MTYAEGLPAQPFTVLGCWPATRERAGEWFMAVDARAAENQMQMVAAERRGEFWCCALVAGHIATVDGYTLFVDPNDPRNDDADVKLDIAGPLAEYTVFGIARDPSNRRTFDSLIGERYVDTVPATSPAAAEDVARSRLADQGGELWVCAVVEGQALRVDIYATVVDPDIEELTA